jgi:hypothetical protein
MCRIDVEDTPTSHLPDLPGAQQAGGRNPRPELRSRRAAGRGNGAEQAVKRDCIWFP